jgi:molecular chaperone Hsp33
VKESLATYHTNDLADMVTDQGVITADCQFCGAHYEFTPDQLGHSFEGEDAP